MIYLLNIMLLLLLLLLLFSIADRLPEPTASTGA